MYTIMYTIGMHSEHVNIIIERTSQKNCICICKMYSNIVFHIQTITYKYNMMNCYS